MIRRVALLLTMMAVALILGSGVALAAYFVGTSGGDNLRGTNNADEMYGLRGNDTLVGRGGKDYIEGGTGFDVIRGGSNDDEIYGGRGQDDLFGNDGDDYINSADNDQPDTVDCGGGVDRAVVDDEDNVIGGPCEDLDTVF